ncbi:enoyl-CoA hydratase/isomerase family protein [Rhodocaloribacter litoris]|uniref:3-hydroxyacyl-CoA dehydrogenase/enoyl-CoA hydratase family protein n=1 Tax=Rhodocaloribacter litoris TaxID=2558931 RepID=UPI001420EE66|nr:3-hydroxyacyl-CoA dehydrogenase/enoyl-CoA hydratase family protein [Rhodocaloribacter litoris]QXD14584.1 enoyl-CoA hydratase/isomerase family protein [Rhodocaloribacter litoris]
METTTLDPKTRPHGAATAHRPFRTVTVLGAGTMGAQIAAHCANAGLTVNLLDIAPRDEAQPRNAVVEAAFQRATKLKPDPFFTDAAKKRIRLGNFDEHFDRVGEADWVIEAVVERMDIKRQVMARVEEVARPDAVISTNTSGLPIAQIAEGRSEAFRRRFMGTHFFNPPRYLKLLEVIPTPDTDPALVERVAHFGRVHLGKGIVIAKDSPYFIGNRIGIYALMVALRHFTEGDYTIEEIDTLTGELVGHPKSATFRTADVVGLDVMKDVIENLYAAVPHDEDREVFRVPEVLVKLVEQGALGAKTGAGFYRKEGKVIKSINPATGQYEEPRPINLEGLDAIKQAGGLADRLRALWQDEGRAGAFFRDTTLRLLSYSARRIPEVTESPADVDRALKWGFGWQMGPFEMWDVLGFEAVVEALREAGLPVAAWVEAMPAHGATTFYRRANGMPQVYVPAEEAYVDDPPPADEISLAAIKTDERRVLWKNPDAALLDLGEGVALYEFRSKANALGQFVMEGLMEAIERVENDPDLRGMVIANEGKNFSVGANLGEVAMAVMSGQMDTVEQAVRGFQQAVQRVRYAAKPVVVAPHQMTLGGACELVMACPNPVVAAETYIGLVELGAGLIPAGTGTMRLAAQAAALAPNGFPNEIQAYLQKYFEQVAMAKVATSARQGQEMGYVASHAPVVMNAERRFFVARQEVIRLSEQGYLPPPPLTHITVLGRPAAAALEVGAYQFLQGRFISAYDFHLAKKLIYVLTGGDLTGPAEVHEDYLLDLEREAFMSLLGEPKTQERIMHLLQHNKPLRN